MRQIFGRQIQPTAVQIEAEILQKARELQSHRQVLRVPQAQRIAVAEQAQYQLAQRLGTVSTIDSQRIEGRGRVGDSSMRKAVSRSVKGAIGRSKRSMVSRSATKIG